MTLFLKMLWTASEADPIKPELWAIQSYYMTIPFEWSSFSRVSLWKIGLKCIINVVLRQKRNLLHSYTLFQKWKAVWRWLGLFGWKRCKLNFISISSTFFLQKPKQNWDRVILTISPMNGQIETREYIKMVRLNKKPAVVHLILHKYQNMRKIFRHI